MAARRTERTTTRETKMTSRRTEAVPDATVKKGMSIADGMAIITAVILIAAILTTDYMLGHRFGTGMFFK